MPLEFPVGRRSVARVAFALLLGSIATQAMALLRGDDSRAASARQAQTILGTAAYRERMALPPGAVLEATLEDVSRADAKAETIAQTRVTSPGNPPIAFTITYDPAKILTDHRYVVRARILVDDKLLFTTDTAAPVITRGSPNSVKLMLRRVGGGPPPPPKPAGEPLQGTYWKAVELAGKPTPSQDPKREAHLQFQAGGRVSGSDGCNRITGTYELKGDAVTFGQMAGTQMACIDAAAEVERAFQEALKGATRLTLVGNRLELSDAAGKRVAALTAGKAAPPSTPHELTGTSWQLVKFQGSDDTTLTPDDRTKYTMAFGAGWRLTARIDCNRGSGSWKSSGPNQLQFGPLALTRAMCPPGSLHDHIVKQLPHIRSYVIKDGHLFLSLMADGGIYELEPVAKAKP